MNQKNLLVLSFFILCFLIQSCWSDKGKNIPDVSNIEVEVVIEDFNLRLFSIDTNDISVGISQLRQEFPVFFDVYFAQVHPFLKSPQLDNYFFENTIALLLKGQNVSEEIASAQEIWSFDAGSIPSLSAPDGVILKLKNLLLNH